MKTHWNVGLFLIVLMLAPIASHATWVSSGDSTSRDVLASEDGILLIRVSDGDCERFEVLASIATAALPASTLAICLLTVKNPAGCMVVYEATNILVGLEANRIKRGISNGMCWIADKLNGTSNLTVISDDQSSAQSAYDALALQKKEGCVNWTNLENSIGGARSVVLRNGTPQDVQFEISADGENWQQGTQRSLTSNPYYLPNSFFFVKVGGEIYHLSTSNTWKFTLKNSNWYVEKYN